MQPPLTYSWIALTASAPVILLLTCWTLAVFHCRRRQWSTVDIFLVAILSQSIMQQFLGFIYSTLVLLKLSTPVTGEAFCTGMMWFFIAIPIFKGTTITSLAVDRWLFSSRFSYRLSIRKTGIRYHIAVLALFSCIFGFTALITFNNPELLVTSLSSSSSSSISSQSQYSFDQCTFLPFKFDLKFVIFYLSVHCIVILVGITVLCKSLCHKNDNKNAHLHPQVKNLHYKRRRRSSPAMDVTPTLSNTSTASSSISNSSPTNFFSTPGLSSKAILNSNSPNNAFHQQLRNPSRMDFPDRNKVEPGSYRLAPALGILILTLLCTHLAFMMGTILSRLEILVPIATFGYGSMDQLSVFNWPLTNVLLWLQVIEGLGTLLVLLIIDNIVPGWIFNRTSKKLLDGPSKITGPYPVNSPSSPKAETSFNPQNIPNLNNRSNGNPNTQYINPAFVPEFKGNNNKFPITNGSLYAGVPAHSSRQSNGNGMFPAGGGRNVNPSPHEVDARFKSAFEGRIAPNKPPRNDFDSIGTVFKEDESEYDRKSYHHRYASVASVTTVANDDFEFHQSRPSIFQGPPQSPNKDYNPSTYLLPSKSQTQMPKQQQFHPKKSLDNEKKQRPQTPNVYEEFENRKHHLSLRNSPGQTQPLSSLSMNDLDLIDDDPENPSSAANTTQGRGTPEPFEHKQRIYRKRARLHPPPHLGKVGDRRGLQKTSDPFSDRRILSSSMECLSPSKQSDKHRNFLDISYLDTGEILVRKADSSKCIFVTDFI